MNYRDELTSTFDCTIEFVKYTETATRVEECHGYHTFEDIRETNVIQTIKINVNGLEIDITDNLTELQKQQISENL